MIITPSVFITTSFDTAFKFMKADSYKQFYSRLSQDERESTILVAPSKDHGLLEFSYNAIGQEQSVTLRFAETSDQFEAFLDSINGSHGYAKNLISIGALQLTSEEIEELYNIQGSGNYTIYLSFGVGDNLSKWSRISRLEFKSSNIQIDDAGVKIVVLEFSNYASPLTYCNLVDTTMTYRLRSEINRSVPFNEKTVIKSDSFSFNPSTDTTEKAQTSILTNVINSYISKLMRVRNDNIIVAIPDVKFYSGIFNGGLDPGTGLTFTRGSGQGIIPSFELPYKTNETWNDLLGLSKLFPEVVNEPKEIINFDCEVCLSNLQSTSENSITNIQDYFYPLFKLGKFLSKHISLADSEYILYEESNLDILNLWKSYGLINSDKENAVVFVPKYFLNNFLFCSQINRLEQVESIDAWGTGVTVYAYSNEVPRHLNSFYAETLIDWRDYALNYYLRFIKDNLKSALDIPVVPDEAALEEEAKTLLDFDGVVFNHNTKNPNVLELQYSTNVYGHVYNVSLDAPVAKIMTDAYDQRGVQALVSKDILNQVETFSSYITEHYKHYLSQLKSFNDYYNFFKDVVYKDIQDKLNKYESLPLEGNTTARIGIRAELDFIRQHIPDSVIKDIGSKKFVWILAQMINPSLRADYSSIKLIADENASKSLLMHEKLINELSVELTVKTLPFFTLILGNALGRSCAVFSVKGKIIGTPEKTFKLNPFSGIYRITGLKHIISDDDCYSEFKLTRVPGGAQQKEAEDIPNFEDIAKRIEASRSNSKPGTRVNVDIINRKISTDYDIFGKKK